LLDAAQEKQEQTRIKQEKAIEELAEKIEKLETDYQPSKATLQL
jgi:hypothetical protein